MIRGEESLYFQVRWVNDPTKFLIAYPVGLSRGDTRPLLARLKRPGYIDHWEPPVWELRSKSADLTELEDGGFADLQPEIDGLRFCSSRFKEIVEQHTSSEDSPQWIDGTVAGPSGETRPYWVIHFPVLDRVRCYDPSMYPDGTSSPVVYGDLVGARQVFASPDGNFLTFTVSGTVRDRLLESGCRGLEFLQIPYVEEAPAFLRYRRKAKP